MMDFIKTGIKKMMGRDSPDVPDARRAFVKQWTKRINECRAHWHESAFKRMREDMDFNEGYQVNGKTAEDSDTYVANLVQNHIRGRVALLYAKNPTAVAKRIPRMESTVWDGTSESAQEVDQRMAMAVQSGMEPDPNDLAFMMEVSRVLEERKMIERVGKTLEILFHYFMREGTPPFKTMAKQLISRVEVCGVGYIKLGFQRVMEKNPEIEQKLADFSTQLAHIEMLAKDMADDEIEEHSAKAEELKEAMRVMQTQVEVIAREGLTFDFPEATAIIVPRCTKHIRGFVGATWIAEEHVVDPEEIKERFSVDIGKEFTPYADGEDHEKSMCRWYEVYDLKTGMVLHIVDGYPDFLEEPKAPPVYMEQGHPYFALTFNPLESRKGPFPRSDVRLLTPVQIEHNRRREAARIHRIASRPGYVVGAGQFDEKDLAQFETHEDMEIMQFKFPPGTDMRTAVVSKPAIPLDPMMYDTRDLFEDFQRISGSQEANLGGTSSGTATEASISESSRMSGIGSNKDDLDDCLTAVARASGQLLLAEMSIEQVQRIVGQGAAWPELSRKDIAEEIYLEIKAGSSGSPNQAQELANFERVAPTMLQTPGIKPKKVAGFMLERLDSGIDIDEWITEGLPSITSINAMSKAPIESSIPDQQGGQGGNNAPKLQARQMGPQPGFPAPGEQPVVNNVLSRVV